MPVCARIRCRLIFYRRHSIRFYCRRLRLFGQFITPLMRWFSISFPSSGPFLIRDPCCFVDRDYPCDRGFWGSKGNSSRSDARPPPSFERITAAPINVGMDGLLHRESAFIRQDLWPRAPLSEHQLPQKYNLNFRQKLIFTKTYLT